MTTAIPTPKPVTLNFSGGISLGAFMAGIFYELIKEALQENPGIVIDIITGGSAGAITGTLAAYYLLGADRLPEEAKHSLFYKAWVELADISNIQATQDVEVDDRTQQKKRSLLSGNGIQRIAESTVSDFIQKIMATKSQSVARPLALLVTLTNLEGYLKKTSFPLEASEKKSSPELEITGEEKTGTIKTISSAETRQFLFYPGLDRDNLRTINIRKNGHRRGKQNYQLF
jgi:hypothetical protein